MAVPISFSLDRLSHYGVGCLVFKEVFGSLSQSLFSKGQWFTDVTPQVCTQNSFSNL